MKITVEYLDNQGLSPTFPERFWSKVFMMTDGKGCWLWTGAIRMPFPRDYGIIARGRVGSSPISAHVASWILHFGPIPEVEGLCVCHSCDNSRCVRPDHLFLGTAQDNADDKMRKGRYVLGKRYRGEENSNSKLKATQVLAIKKLNLSGVSTKHIARQFNVWATTIESIIKGKTWNHINV